MTADTPTLARPWHFVLWIPMFWTAVAWAGVWVNALDRDDSEVVPILTAPMSALVWFIDDVARFRASDERLETISLWAGPIVPLLLALAMVGLRIRLRWFALVWVVHCAALLRYGLGLFEMNGVLLDRFPMVACLMVLLALNLSMVFTMVLVACAGSVRSLYRRVRGW